VKSKKIYELKQLSTLLGKARQTGRRIVHCHGVFDLLHIGHIRHFEQAREHGDMLVVTVTPDRFVDKGPHRPAFSEQLRAEAVASLNSVDYVAINQWPTAVETIALLKPHVFVKGSEFKEIASDLTGKIGLEQKAIQAIGAELVFTEDIVFSSTNLINRYLSNLPEELDNYLKLFRSRYALDEVLEVLERMRSLKALVIGDTILDEYQYCEAIGKSSKDPALTVRYQSMDIFAGGVLAVANHVAGFVGTTHLATILGAKESHEDFIRSHLASAVAPFFVYQSNASTLIKRRFIDGYSFNKLFEVYVMDDSGLSADKEAAILAWLDAHLASFDLVIVADYGHGAISDRIVALLCDQAPLLCVNTQANSGNRGFHTICRYPRADYVCLAEHEIRLEMRSRNGDLRPMIENLTEKLNATQMVVTRGRKGCLVYNRQGQFVAVPAFTSQVVDRVGAGDSFFAITAPAAAMGVSNEILGFIGNIVGAVAVGMLGNKHPIDKQSLQKQIVSFMK
jgi:rfaE bifunctional protein kinase chain/domain/rfaE bifunctional protein nucleotidyltransferase chain/domain